MTTTATPTTAELVARATAWVPTLRARSAETEQARRIPDVSVREFLDRGLHLIPQPTRFGGYGLGVDVVAEVAREVGRGCCSTAWMAGQWPGHQYMVGTFPLEAQEEYWGPGPDTLSSTASAVSFMDCKPERDGLRVSAKMRFSSGCDAAEWILLGVPNSLTLVPKSDFVVEDDWHVSGLRGTGSKTVVFDDIFIPPHRMVLREHLANGTTPGATLYPDYPYYHMPFPLVLNTMLLSPTIGMARGILDLFEERALDRIDGHTATKAFERPGAQLRFGEATAMVQSAILLLDHLFEMYVEFGSARRPWTVLDRARARLWITHAAKQCVQAADLLLEQGDASGQYDHQLWQRWGRDIHMAGLQVALTADEPAMSYSQAKWGLQPSSLHT